MSAPLDEAAEIDEVVEDPPEEKNYTGRGFAALAVLVGGVGWLTYRLYPAHHRIRSNPNFIDNIFGNNLVVFAARLVLVATAVVLAVTAVFVVVSYWKRGQAGHWLTRFGPLETQAIEDLRADVEMWRQWWTEQAEEVQRLQEQLEASDALIAQLYEQLQALTERKSSEEDVNDA